jgi:hypothetical protein
MSKSAQSESGPCLDLYSRKVVDDKYVVSGIKPQQLINPFYPLQSSLRVRSFLTA